MASTTGSTPSEEPIPDEPADMLLTMAASVVLDQLPRDASSALEHAGELAQAKGLLLLLAFSSNHLQQYVGLFVDAVQCA